MRFAMGHYKCRGTLGSFDVRPGLNKDEFVDELTRRCYDRGLECGLPIKRVKLSDPARVRALRVHMDQINTFKE